MMRPYWVTFERPAKFSTFGLGFGVTASSEDDVRQILAASVPDAPAILTVTPIKDMRDLDQGHVVPNMSNWFPRGIWFPKGYENSN